MSLPPSHPPRETGIHPQLPQAVALHQAGRLQEAAKLYELILTENPKQFDALHLLGVVAMQEGRLEEAQSRITAALELEPENGSALSNLVVIYLRTGQFDNALETGKRAVGNDADSIDALINLGMAAYELGRFDEAIPPLRAARNLSPNSALICNLLGASLLKVGDAPAAIDAFEAATTANPGDADGWANLSAALNAVSEHDRALECARKSLSLRADSSSALGSQAASLYELGKVDEAIASYRKAVAHAPSIEVLCGFANALLTSGLNEEASIYLRQAIELDGDNAHARWILAISTLKAIYRDQQEVAASRANLAAAMTELESWHRKRASPYAYLAVGATQPFFIAYQEFNNRELLKQYGELCCSWMRTFQHSGESTRIDVPRTPKFRIGIASAHIRDHSVWNAITKGWAYGLDKNKFEVFLFQLNPMKDKETAAAKRHFDFFEDQEKTLRGWVDAISKSHLDFLLFPELGMDALTYQLAAQRLAPLQAVTWGHPETSGVPTVDFYISGEAIEPPQAQENYTEKLVRLPNLGVYVEALKPKIHDPNLKALGLPGAEPLLLCPGRPFKYLPSHDDVWVQIAKGLHDLGRGRLVFFTSSTGAMYLELLQRLRHAFGDAGVDFDERVCVVPTLDRARFFGLMQKSALLLDTLGFSGFNTAIQALECGLPVLAYEGRFMRGRLASGIMRTMGMPELVATTPKEFVERAVQLASDRGKLKRLRAEIPKRRDILFRDTAPVRALEAFFEMEIARQRTAAAVDQAG